MLMKNYPIYVLLFFFLFFGIFNYGNSQASITKVFYDTLTSEKSTIAYEKYWIDSIMRNQMADSAWALLQIYPDDKYSAFLLRYYIFNERFTPYTKEKYDSLVALVERYESRFPKIWLTYNQLTSIYHTLGTYSNFGNDLRSKKIAEQKGIYYAKLAVSAAEREGNNTARLLAIYKLFGLYNNLGSTLYSASHHLDPLEKRNQVGPLIEQYWLKADSCYNVFFEGGGSKINGDSCYRVEATTKLNLATLYGHYYHNELKSKLYFEQSKNILDKCANNYYLAQYYISQGWIAFCWDNFDGAIPKFKQAIPLFNSPEKLYSDAYFGLTMSYFKINQYDSALVYGKLLFKDTAFVQDHVFLSMAATAMSEIYLEKENTGLAKTYLQLSKQYLAKSQHNQIVEEFIREGETIMVNQIVDKITNLTRELDYSEQHTKRLRLLFWVALGGISFLAIGYFVFKITALNKIQRTA